MHFLISSWFLPFTKIKNWILCKMFDENSYGKIDRRMHLTKIIRFYSSFGFCLELVGFRCILGPWADDAKANLGIA